MTTAWRFIAVFYVFTRSLRISEALPFPVSEAEVQFYHLSDHLLYLRVSSTYRYNLNMITVIIILLVDHFPRDDAHSVRLRPYHSDCGQCLCRLLDEWPTSSKSSSGAQNVSFDWKPSFNAQHTRMGDVCKVGTSI